MKVFISADLDGICSTMDFAEVTPSGRDYSYHCKIMTDEVVAACDGAIRAGATEIVIKDAHHKANNIDITRLPKCAKLIRGWSMHPYMMVDGINNSFDALMFVGYHSAAGTIRNPMSHTSTAKAQKAYINGEPFSELKLYSWCAAREGVPTVFLSGDKGICDEAKTMYPWVATVAVKDGDGASVCCLSPAKACEEIENRAYECLLNLKNAKVVLPDHFDVQVIYKNHADCNKASYYPGMKRTDTHTLEFEANDIYDVACAMNFIV